MPLRQQESNSHDIEALVKLDKGLAVQLAALGAMRQEQVALQQQHAVQGQRLSALKVQDDR